VVLVRDGARRVFRGLHKTYIGAEKARYAFARDCQRGRRGRGGKRRIAR
jgi:hypothetical protein